MKRTRLQKGCLELIRRKREPDLWALRFRQVQPDGSVKLKKVTIGTLVELPSRPEAEAAAARLLPTLPQEVVFAAVITVADAIRRYREDELEPDVMHEERAASTKAAYNSYLTNWIEPGWGSRDLNQVKAADVKSWLRSLTLQDGTKAKIRNIMSAVFNHAAANDWVTRNPIQFVRQSAKRSSIPDILTAEELRCLIDALEDPVRTAVILDTFTGVRVSELFALKWADIDFESFEINVRRSIVHQIVGPCKTEVSKKLMPMDSFIAETLWKWRGLTPYHQSDDWVFASPEKGGRQPYWPDNLLKRYIKPAVEALAITKCVGWHTFRRTFSTLLKANGEDVKVVQELLRHANSRITLDTYTQAVSKDKRAAQTAIVRQVLEATGTAGKHDGT